MTTVQTYLSVNYCDRLGLEIRALTISTDLELHGAELVHDVMQRLAYDAERDLVVALRRRLHAMTGQVVESNDVSQHAHRLVERAVAIVRRVAVLKMRKSSIKENCDIRKCY